MRVEYDPTDTFSVGATFPYADFLVSLNMGVYPLGMKVIKVAVTSEFTVAISPKGHHCLEDKDGHVWLIVKNKSNVSGYQLRHDIPSHERLLKHQT
jgi:hypothetical protein